VNSGNNDARKLCKQLKRSSTSRAVVVLVITMVMVMMMVMMTLQVMRERGKDMMQDSDCIVVLLS